jgi:hypothetical protein
LIGGHTDLADGAPIAIAGSANGANRANRANGAGASR